MERVSWVVRPPRFGYAGVCTMSQQQLCRRDVGAVLAQNVERIREPRQVSLRDDCVDVFIDHRLLR